jgi:hypothetical protein
VQRLDAEAIRDATLAVSGVLQSTMYGPPVPVREDVSGQIVVGIDKKEGDNKMPVEVAMGGEAFRRSIYIQVRRSQPLAFLNAFDAPVMEVNCEKRIVSTAAPQALMLMNSQFILDQAALFADRVRRESSGDPRRQIERAWHLAWGRPPSDEELSRSLDFLNRQIVLMRAGEGDDVQRAASPESQALANLCQVLLSANEFLYVN